MGAMAREAGAALLIYNTITRIERTDVEFDDPQEPEDYWTAYRLDLSVHHLGSDWESPPVGALEYEILNGEMADWGGLPFSEIMDLSHQVHDQCLPFFLDGGPEWDPAMAGIDVPLAQTTSISTTCTWPRRCGGRASAC